MRKHELILEGLKSIRHNPIYEGVRDIQDWIAKGLETKYFVIPNSNGEKIENSSLSVGDYIYCNKTLVVGVGGYTSLDIQLHKGYFLVEGYSKIGVKLRYLSIRAGGVEKDGESNILKQSLEELIKDKTVRVFKAGEIVPDVVIGERDVKVRETILDVLDNLGDFYNASLVPYTSGWILYIPTGTGKGSKVIRDNVLIRIKKALKGRGLNAKNYRTGSLEIVG